MNGMHYWLVGSGRQWAKNGAFRYAVLTCYLLVLGFLSLNPWVRPASGSEILSPDRLEHAFAYGGLTIIIFSCVSNSLSSVRSWMASVSLAVLIGVLIEVAQGMFTQNRTGSVEDAVANAVGAGLGYVAYNVVKYIHAKLSE